MIIALDKLTKLQKNIFQLYGEKNAIIRRLLNWDNQHP